MSLASRDASLRSNVGWGVWLGLIAACDDGGGMSPIPVASVAVTPPSATVPLNGTVQLAVTVRDANGNSLSDRLVTWTTSSSAIAPVSSTGLVHGFGAGRGTITASSEGVSGIATIDVELVCNNAAGQTVSLAAASYVSLAPPADAGCLLFAGNASATDSVHYLLVPQLATDSPGATSGYVLDGDTLHQALHAFLRRQEQSRFAAIPLAPGTVGPGVARAARLPPPVVGSTRTFSVCATPTCSSSQPVTGTVKTVTGSLALYVDNAAPAGGLTQGDFDSLGVLLTRLYVVDTTAFGRESDLDNSAVVAVLMTNVVNTLVSQAQCAQTGFPAGFFFGADIDPAFAADPRFNHGEVFYSLVADPGATLSCAHSVSQILRLVPLAFVHEFQHMVGYNQHVVVRGGVPQAAWLDEGLSHFAEELAGRSFLPGDPGTFSSFLTGNVVNAYRYLDSPGPSFLVSSGIGTLAEQGAAWLFVRYLADQFAADTAFPAVATFTRSLVQTSLVGGAAVTASTGQSFATVVTRWALANYVSDLPGFTAPPELRYTSWAWRATFANLNAQQPSLFPKPFPLTPVATTGNLISLSGSLRAGSGYYALASQGPSAPGFALLFSGPNGSPFPPALVPRLNVIRLR